MYNNNNNFNNAQNNDQQQQQVNAGFAVTGAGLIDHRDALLANESVYRANATQRDPHLPRIQGSGGAQRNLSSFSIQPNSSYNVIGVSQPRGDAMQQQQQSQQQQNAGGIPNILNLTDRLAFERQHGGNAGSRQNGVGLNSNRSQKEREEDPVEMQANKHLSIERRSHEHRQRLREDNQRKMDTMFTVPQNSVYLDPAVYSMSHKTDTVEYRRDNHREAFKYAHDYNMVTNPYRVSDADRQVDKSQFRAGVGAVAAFAQSRSAVGVRDARNNTNGGSVMDDMRQMLPHQLQPGDRDAQDVVSTRQVPFRDNRVIRVDATREQARHTIDVGVGAKPRGSVLDKSDPNNYQNGAARFAVSAADDGGTVGGAARANKRRMGDYGVDSAPLKFTRGAPAENNESLNNDFRKQMTSTAYQLMPQVSQQDTVRNMRRADQDPRRINLIENPVPRGTQSRLSDSLQMVHAPERIARPHGNQLSGQLSATEAAASFPRPSVNDHGQRVMAASGFGLGRPEEIVQNPGIINRLSQMQKQTATFDALNVKNNRPIVPIRQVDQERDRGLFAEVGSRNLIRGRNGQW